MPPPQSPCKTCDKHPCKEPKGCQARWEYVEKIGQPGIQAVDTTSEYGFLPK